MHIITRRLNWDRKGKTLFAIILKSPDIPIRRFSYVFGIPCRHHKAFIIHATGTFQGDEVHLKLPIIIDVIDTKENIMAILPEAEEMIEDGLVVIHDVQMLRKVPKKE
ncbi:MAG TPA: DUF190 domain-containing protein [Methanoregula sp.]|nr:DUF190 domain-containing protein [Methanoregula sp.]